MSVPSSILPPLGSSETEAWIGTARSSSFIASRAPKIAALTSRMSWAVSMMIRSDAAADEALGLLGEDGDEVAEADVAERRVVGGGQVARRADRAGDEAVRADGLAGDLRGLDVDLERVVGQAPLLELQAAGLEGVGLDDLRARLDHRRVDALDDVRAVEDEGLVRTPGQLVVVLQREVELLERRAHAAVEDDDALAGGLEVVTHRPSMLPADGQP